MLLLIRFVGKFCVSKFSSKTDQSLSGILSMGIVFS